MSEYNLAAEIAAFVIVTILAINLFFEKEIDSRRNKFFKGIVIAIFFLVVYTLVSSLLAYFPYILPIWVSELVMVLYFTAIPLALVMGLLYTQSLNKGRNEKTTLTVGLALLMLPYAAYLVVIVLNFVFHNVFTLTQAEGYKPGVLSQLPYPVALFYIVAIFIVAFRNRKQTNKMIGFVICVNVSIMACISFAQFFYPYVLLSGIANVAGALVVYLYIQNVTKSTDILTGLYNRDRLTYNITKRLKAYKKRNPIMASNKSYTFSLVVFSLRNIKGINERFGLEGGDEVFESFAKYLRAVAAPCLAYRYSGDEFAVLLDSQIADKNTLIQNAASFFNEPCLIGRKKTPVSVNVVYARVDFPEFGKGVKTLISALDYSIAILKHEKKRNNYMYDLTISEKVSRRNSIIDRIKYALDNDGFEMYYQPIHSTVDNSYKEAEALIRMRTSIGSIYPDEFIPLAEETGLIVNMTYLVIDKVCKDLRQLIDVYGEKMKEYSISINFPYAQFLEHDLVDKVMGILNLHNIDPKQIKIEITERTLIGDAGLITGVMREMQEKGFIFEIDDFGVDYSNISLILHLPVEIIKIDRSLVLLATKKESNEEFFRLFLKAIRHTGRKVVIEGIETKEQADFFEGCGSEYIQGYYYSHPLSFTEYLDFLKKK